MESGQIFVLDEAAVEELKDVKVTVGLEYSIVKTHGNITPLNVRASKWVDGKPQKGRPRTFKRSLVARLLGEMDDASLTNSAEVVEVATEEVEAASVQKMAEEMLANPVATVEATDSTPW